ncbi:dTMP kinase [uncultured Mailhella sp.]|uniref:dTMP kinase n=1 Tax=uncultured Mailhella sp. TaxID=1981031 RepID=UPI0025F152E8|nr:dTMP kinase [uncultured Mailhella sp.]
MFVTVEGVEGAGKSTLLGLLAGEFERRALPFVRTREPGGCALGARIRPLLLDVSSRVDERAELFLFLADRAQHVAETIRPALQRGAWVLCDRYADSTIAYQGYGRGMDVETLQRLNDYATGGLWPDKTLLLDLPVETGLSRALARNGREGLTESEGRFEAEEQAFHQRIREGFLARAERWPERFCVLDARLSPEELLACALEALGLSRRA